jgi:UDP-2-acetamido-3-amino-2,3-dideoxy-glucuronate N-acetyltransferase
VSSYTFICEGVTIEDAVFAGHNVTFINDTFPRAASANGKLQTEQDWVCVPKLVKRRACTGSSATLSCGLTVEENAIIGARGVVTMGLPLNTIVVVNPARIS